MCVGSIGVLADRWDAGGVVLGRMDDGCVVVLSYVPEARPNTHLLLHLGIPVEVLEEEAAREALDLRGGSR